jgi:peptidoglycan/xylan/chitin deacetylase (PgdA/CDA1 family)
MIILLFVLFPGETDWGQCQESLTKEQMILKFSGRIPKEWGVTVKGVKTGLNTDQKVIALTFDACGGLKGSGYDAELIAYLVSQAIPATLFISGKWIDANQNVLMELSQNPLFEIENHGWNHKPCSVNGRSIYGVKGTSSISELIDEIEENAVKIQKLSGRKPKYYRPGTAYCDEIGVEVANALGYEVVNFSVLGDAGATYKKNQVKKVLLHAPPSSIILMHMNHPQGETAEGLIEAIPELKKKGFKFVKLSEYGLR